MNYNGNVEMLGVRDMETRRYWYIVRLSDNQEVAGSFETEEQVTEALMDMEGDGIDTEQYKVILK